MNYAIEQIESNKYDNGYTCSTAYTRVITTDVKPVEIKWSAPVSCDERVEVERLFNSEGYVTVAEY